MAWTFPRSYSLQGQDFLLIAAHVIGILLSNDNDSDDESDNDRDSDSDNDN